MFVCVLRVFAFLRARLYSFFAHRFVSSIFFFFIFIINDNNNAAASELSPFVDQRSFRLYTSSRKNVEIDIISQIAARNGTNDYTYNRDSSLLISMYQSNDTHIYI